MTRMKAPLNVAIAGLGTVGTGVALLLQEQAAMIEARVGRSIRVVAVADPVRDRDRGVSFENVTWYDDALLMVAEAKADVVVETIGGSGGIALKVVESALAHGCHVVTANKAMLAHHGTALALTAEAKGVSLAYEAAVAGGIPVIKALREGLVGNKINKLYGILNGTCNYILTTMRETGREFADVLAEAQRLGYAEADPSFDIDGIDTAHKLSLLSSLAFGSVVDFDSVQVEGIRHVSAVDIAYADDLGYRIKLLGTASMTETGLEQRVSPCMVPKSSSIGQVDGVFNAVVFDGDFVGRSVLEGRGAGARPTASAVVADIVDIAAGRYAPTFGIPATTLQTIPAAQRELLRGRYYIRLTVADRPGVFADIAAALRDENVSIEAVIQRVHAPGEAVPVVMTLHDTYEGAMLRAIEKIEALQSIVEPAHMIRIESL